MALLFSLGRIAETPRHVTSLFLTPDLGLLKLKTICAAWLVVLMLGRYQAAPAQFIPYTQYNHAPLFTNPARASLTDDTQLTLQYRKSKTGNYEIPSLSFVLPFYRQANGLRYGGVGASVIQQKAGPNGIYKITGATGTFAYTLHLSSHHHIGAGLSGGIVNKKLDASRITTDAQFSYGAYDASLPTGENFQANSVTQAVIHTGFCWVMTDAADQEVASLGVAAYNINQPAYALLENGSAQEAVTYVVSGDVRVVNGPQVSVVPTLRYVYQGGLGSAHIGSWVRYTPGATSDVLGAALWYKTTGALIGALQYNHSHYVLGASLDISTASSMDANMNNAFELSLGWRMNRKEKVSARRAHNTPTTAPTPVATDTPVTQTPEAPKEEEAMVTEPAPVTEAPQPAPSADRAATTLTPAETQLASTHIQFDLGSDEVSAERDAFFNELAAAVQAHPDYQLKITGHSCTLGDKAINKTVSYERARAVADELVKRGVPEDRLIVIGMDYQQPIASNDTEAGRRQNRRVAFEWIK